MGRVFDDEAMRAYEAWASSREGKAVERGLEGLFRVLVEPQPRERIVDIGCGSGSHLILFGRMGLSGWGVEPSEAVLQKARRRLGERVILRRGRAEDLPFEDNSFDIAALINTLEFVEDPLEALREAGRVARRRVFVGVFNGFSWGGLFKGLKAWGGHPLFSGCRFYHLWELKGLFREAFGDVPVSWGCVRAYRKGNHPPPASGRMERSPFGTFLGVCAAMGYTFRTEGIPLTVRIKGRSPVLPLGGCHG